MSSLRSRLLIGTTAAVTLVLALAGASLFSLVERSLVGEIDRELTAKTRLFASMVEWNGDFLDLEDFGELDMHEFAAPELGSFLQLWDADCETLYRSRSLGDGTLACPDAEPLSAAHWIDLPGGQRGRAVSHAFRARVDGPAPGPGLDEFLTILVVRDANEVDGVLATLQALLWIVGLVTVAASSLVLVGVVRRSVRPVEAVAERIAEIDEDDLATPLDEAGVPAELLPVVQRVNGLLARLAAAFARERGFSNDVAHELRTPLSGLRSTLEVTGSRPRTAPELEATVQESAAMVVQLQSIVERLLALARLDARKGDRAASRAPKPYDLPDLVLDAWEPFTVRAAERRLAVALELEEGLSVFADRELMTLVCRNLLENAVAYADDDGTIGVSLRRSNGNRVLFEVSNSGSRLSQEEAASATARFWRGDAARAGSAGHCGLGLSLADKAAQALDGDLRLRSSVGGEFVASFTLHDDGAR